MDQKTWLWRKKASEKIILTTDKVNLSHKDNEEEIKSVVDDRREFESELKILNNKLSSALSDCKSKDELVKKHEKMAMEAVFVKEKVEAEAVFLKQERDEALLKRVACEERQAHLESALKGCMQQLRFVREEQERRIHDAVTKASREFEKSRTILDAQLAESSQRVTELGVENTNLRQALMGKEKVIDDLNKQRGQMETDLDALMTKVEFTEKDNASLKYEVRVLQKELEIRNEEREFNRRTAEVSHKQHLESVKKIAKLESECQRLRLLVRKRLPGPAALAKMKNEVEMLGKDSIDMSRRKLNQSPNSSGLDFVVDNYSDSPRKRINILNEQLCAMEEENRALKEALNKKTSELQISRVTYARTASKLSEAESHEVSLPSISDAGSDDKASGAEYSASALISKLDQFKNRQLRESLLCKTVGSPEINLMDDFVEMEKLALASADQIPESSHVSSDDESNRTLEPLQNGSRGYLEVMCKEIVPVTDSQFDHSESERPLLSKDPDLSKSICRIIELIEGIDISSADNIHESLIRERSSLSYKQSKKPSGYMVRMFQWKTSELGAILQQFVLACHELLNGKKDLNQFTQELTSALEWIINHSFSLQDVSSMKDEIKKHFDWDESRSKSEAEVGMVSQFVEADKSHLAVPDGKNDFLQKKEHSVTEENRKLREELIAMEASKKHLEDELQSTTNRSDSLSNQLEESEKTIVNLQVELDNFKRNEEMVVGQDENKNDNENLDNQLLLTKVLLNKGCQKFPSHDLESENENYCHDELEVTCLYSVTEKEISNSDIKSNRNQFRTGLEIAAASDKLAECQETILNLGKQLKALASPNEAIFFDKVVSAPTEIIAPTSTEILTPPRNSMMSQRSSLLDQMIAEDNAETNDLASPKAKAKGNLSSSFTTNKTEDNAAVKSLAIVPSKKQGGSLWKKLLWRKTKSKSKKTSLPFAS